MRNQTNWKRKMGSKLNALMTNMSLKQTLIEPAFIDFFSQPLWHNSGNHNINLLLPYKVNKHVLVNSCLFAHAAVAEHHYDPFGLVFQAPDEWMKFLVCFVVLLEISGPFADKCFAMFTRTPCVAEQVLLTLQYSQILSSGVGGDQKESCYERVTIGLTFISWPDRRRKLKDNGAL